MALRKKTFFILQWLVSTMEDEPSILRYKYASKIVKTVTKW